jgi:hypothetical protein
MTRDFGLQFPLLLEIGVRVHPHVFLGAFTGLSFGGVSSQFSTGQGCGQNGRSCLASTLRIGIEVQVHFTPERPLDWWGGYGIGLESSTASATGGSPPEASEGLTGFEVARLAAGFDYKLSRVIAVGPYAELALGTYSHAHVVGYQGSVQQQGDSDISNTALHMWPSIGFRVVLFP